jgi:succinate dehydrogenase/fumarate reductase cytochrome b subunit
MGETEENHLQRFNRLLVWPTLVLFIFLTISGYGTLNPGLISELTGGLFTHAFSLYLHTTLVLPTLTLLMVHILIAIRSTLTRWGIRESKLLDAFLVLLGAFALTLIALMQYLVI